jgi:hypothetical protein
MMTTMTMMMMTVMMMTAGAGAAAGAMTMMTADRLLADVLPNNDLLFLPERR